MADGLFTGVIETLRTMGFFDVLLPFLLIFAIVFGILEKVKLFDRHDLNAVIAFVIGMLVIGTAWTVGLLSGFLPWVGTLSVVFLGAIILMAFFWGDMGAITKSTPAKIIAGVVILAIFAVVLVPMMFPDLMTMFAYPQMSAFSLVDLGALIAILAVFFGIYYVAKGGSKGSKT
jgi:hypothetical protein